MSQVWAPPPLPLAMVMVPPAPPVGLWVSPVGHCCVLRQSASQPRIIDIPTRVSHFILATNRNNFFLFAHSRMTKDRRRTRNIQTSDAWKS